MINVVKIILSLFLIIAPSWALAQKKGDNLTTMLKELSTSKSINISFSPNFTNRIYPSARCSSADSIDDILTLLLSGTSLAFKKTSDKNYYIYKIVQPKTASVKPIRKKKSKKPVPPPIVEQFRDTVPLQPLKLNRLADVSYVSYVASAPHLHYSPSPIAPKERPYISFKLNIIPLLTTTINYAIEVGVSERLSFDLSSSINLWNLGEEISFKHYGIKPELRIWTKERLNGSFFGADLFTYYFDMYKSHSYQGITFGLGASYGYRYSFPKRKSWALEATAGVGYAHAIYTKDSTQGNYNYFGLTKLGLSIVYSLSR